MDKKTPLYDRHIKAGARMVSFAGYLLPIQYSGIVAEHMAVREKAGLFDVSHMGEILLEGPDTINNLNYLLTNEFSDLKKGYARYSPMCNEKGGIIDDVIVYNYDNEKYLIVVNASNKDKDYKWIKENIKGNTKISDISDDIALIAIQGPNSSKILSLLTSDLPEKRFASIVGANIQNIKVHISRTGYTGEDGFEIYCNSEDAGKVWDMLMEIGSEHGLIPCGLGARDTLRFEAGLPLYGNELNEDITPIEAGLGFFVKMNKADFIGKKAISNKKDNMFRIGLKLIDRGIARPDCDIYKQGIKVGKTTSATHCPYLAGAYAMALVQDATHKNYEIEVRGKLLKAEVANLPFYKKTK